VVRVQHSGASHVTLSRLISHYRDAASFQAFSSGGTAFGDLVVPEFYLTTTPLPRDLWGE